MKTMTNPRNTKREDSVDAERFKDVIDPDKFKKLNKTVLNTLTEKEQQPKDRSDRMKYQMRGKKEERKGFFFPRRQRFNEDTHSEILS